MQVRFIGFGTVEHVGVRLTVDCNRDPAGALRHFHLCGERESHDRNQIKISHDGYIIDVRGGLLRQFVDWGSSKTPQELASICLARIAERDSALKAWVEVAPQFSDCAGPLAGIPYAAKDIYETRGLATEFGSPLYAGRTGQ